MSDHLIRAMIRPLHLRLVVALSTELSREAARRHRATAVAACVLSRGLTAGALLATLTSREERVTIQLRGGGPLRGLNVDCFGDGTVRGYPLLPAACGEATEKMAKRQRTAPFLGQQGVVDVVRDIGLADRTQGQVAFVTGEVDEDVEAYLRDSEQIPSALGCEVIMHSDGEILCAGGVLAQIMPDSPPESGEHLRAIQHMLRSGELYDRLKTAPDSAEALARLVSGPYADGVAIIDERPLRFQCRCDLSRIEAMVQGLPLQDLDELIAEGRAEITCEYCREIYRIEGDRLLQLRAARKLGPSN